MGLYSLKLNCTEILVSVFRVHEGRGLGDAAREEMWEELAIRVVSAQKNTVKYTQ